MVIFVTELAPFPAIRPHLPSLDGEVRRIPGIPQSLASPHFQAIVEYCFEPDSCCHAFKPRAQKQAHQVHPGPGQRSHFSRLQKPTVFPLHALRICAHRLKAPKPFWVFHLPDLVDRISRKAFGRGRARRKQKVRSTQPMGTSNSAWKIRELPRAIEHVALPAPPAFVPNNIGLIGRYCTFQKSLAEPRFRLAGGIWSAAIPEQDQYRQCQKFILTGSCGENYIEAVESAVWEPRCFFNST